MSRAPIRVCFPFIGDDVGGSHVSAAKLIAGLDPACVHAVAVLHQEEGPTATFLRRERIPFIHLPVPGTLSPRSGDGRLRVGTYLTGTLRLLRGFLRDGRFDIVHTNDGRIHATWGPAARLCGAKLVWHHRGDPYARGANLLAPVLANHIITVSRFAAPARPLLPIAGRCSIIHSPFDRAPATLDRNAAKAALLEELGLPPGTRTLGYFGALIDRKRPVAFVDVVHRIRLACPGTPIVGCLFGGAPTEGPDLAAAVQKRADELQISRSIRVMGFRQPVEPLLAAMDALLVTAHNEPFGRTLIEAMLLGTPVVATRHGGNVEAIEHGATGFLVDPHDSDAFVEPVRQILEDPVLAARIADTALAWATERFSVARHVEEVTGIYARLLRRAGETEPLRRLAAGPDPTRH